MKNLARIRKERGLSQNELIKLSGVCKSAVLKYEIGERDINKASGITLLKLATALSCKIEDLLEGKKLWTMYYLIYIAIGEKQGKKL